MYTRKNDAEMYARQAGVDMCITSTDIDTYKTFKDADTRNEISGCWPICEKNWCWIYARSADTNMLIELPDADICVILAAIDMHTEKNFCWHVLFYNMLPMCTMTLTAAGTCHEINGACIYREINLAGMWLLIRTKRRISANMRSEIHICWNVS